MRQTRPFCFPQILRKCLVERLRGSASVTEIDATGGSASVFVDNGLVVGTVTDIPELAGETDATARASATIAYLCRVRDAEVVFDPSMTDAPADKVSIPIPNVLISAIKSVRDTSTIIGWLGDMSVELIAAPDLFEILGSAVLEPQEGYFVSQLSGGFELGALVEGSAVGRDTAARLLCALRFANAIIPTGSDDKWMSEDDEDLPEAEPAVDMAEVARVCYLVDEKLRAIEDGADYYAILDVERRAPADRIKASYRELAKVFHPDRHAQLATYSEDIKDRLEAIFTGVTEAYQTLSHPKDREAYDRKLSMRDQKSAVQTPAPERPPVPTPKPPPRPEPVPPAAARPAPPQSKPTEPPPPVRPSQPPPAASDPQSTKRAHGGAESRKVHQDDLSRKSKKEPATATASTNGPKRPPIPVSIVPPVPKAPKPPPASAQGAEAPQNPNRPQPAPVHVPRLHPDTLFEHGTAYAASGDFERAIQAFMRGVELAPTNARMHAALGGALADLHGLNKTSEASLRKAVEIEPNSAELFVELASVYQRCGRESEARTLYKRALLLDPDNADAIEALGGKKANKEVTDFFKNIFKK